MSHALPPRRPKGPQWTNTLYIALGTLLADCAGIFTAHHLWILGLAFLWAALFILLYHFGDN